MHTVLHRPTNTVPSAVVGRPRLSSSDKRSGARRPPAQPRQPAATKTGAKTRQAEALLSPDAQNQLLASWMRAAQTGDRIAYERLLRVSIPFIKMVARRQGVAPDFVDDVVQDTLLTIHRIRETYDPARSYLAWLSTIAQRRAIDLVRSQGRTSRREVYEPLALENHSDPAANPEDAADQVDRKNVVGFAVATLPAKQREAVEQIALNGRSLADAAAVTGLTPGALKVNLHRALKTLSGKIESAMSDHVFANDAHVFVKQKM